MKMHFGQLQNQACRCGKKEPAKAGVPAWVPPAHIIPLIDRQEREKNRRKRPPANQPHVEIDIPPEQTPLDRENDDSERGVVIIDLMRA